LLQTFIALGAFAGFWVIRSSAKEAARDAARTTVGHFVKTDEFESVLHKELLTPEVQSIINRSVQIWADSQNWTASPAGGDNNLTLAAGEEDGAEG